jgi:hypothetical protein
MQTCRKKVDQRDRKRDKQKLTKNRSKKVKTGRKKVGPKDSETGKQKLTINKTNKLD